MGRPYLKEWRKHRDLTQEQVVDRLAALDDPNVPQTAASLSRLENGKQIYTQRSLEALADIYQCEAGELFDPPPKPQPEAIKLPTDGSVVSIWEQLSRKQQRQALAVIDAIRRESA
jgi:transcriptional regulator with XRE-family HTH domain